MKPTKIPSRSPALHNLNPRTRATVIATILAACVASIDLTSQRGGRGQRREPPPEVKERWGNYFKPVEMKTATQSQDVIDLASILHVTDAVAQKEGALLYLFDGADRPEKRKKFEQAMFNQNKINPGLRLFRCATIDLAKEPAARKEYGHLAPLFVIFNGKGKRTGIVSMKGYKSSPAPLVTALRTGFRGHSKLTFDAWVKTYGKFTRQLTNLDAQRAALVQKRTRLERDDSSSNKKKLAKLDKEFEALDKEWDKQLAMETKLLARGRIPKRDPDANLIGEPERRRGR